jgi:hypothetical protein
VADVRCTLSAILTLLADNTAGDISPQDLRDAILSASPVYGALYVSSAAATTLAGAATPTKASGTTASIAAHTDVTVATTNRLTYTAAPTVKVLALMAVSMTCATSTQTVAISIAKNGTQVAATIIQRKIGTGSDKGAVATFGVIELAQNDYVEMFVQNDDSTGAITLNKGIFAILSVFV